MYSIDMWCVSSVKKQSINISFSVTIKINSHSNCTCIKSAGTEASLNTDNQKNKTNRTYCNFTLLFYKHKRSIFQHNCNWLQLLITCEIKYNFLYASSQHYQYAVCAVQLSILTTQHTQTVHNITNMQSVLYRHHY